MKCTTAAVAYFFEWPVVWMMWVLTYINTLLVLCLVYVISLRICELFFAESIGVMLCKPKCQYYVVVILYW